jgi:hypothetical protein
LNSRFLTNQEDNMSNETQTATHTAIRVLQPHEIAQATGGTASYLANASSATELALQFYPGALDVRSGPMGMIGTFEVGLYL